MLWRAQRIALDLGFALALVACGGTAVIDGTNGDGSSSGDGGGGDAPSTGGEGGSLPPTPEVFDGVVHGVDPVTISLASFPRTCAAPDAPSPVPCGYWTVELRVPAALLVAGPLDPAEVSGYSTVAGPPEAGHPDPCYAGAGTFFGDVTITQVDDERVELTISGADVFDIPSGAYTAQRCL